MWFIISTRYRRIKVCNQTKNKKLDAFKHLEAFESVYDNVSFDQVLLV
jgi:hypothetical protein